ncbi:MAG: NAD(P)-dependent glycerol-3-phosphate dehydrogenase [Candidatus Aminicenantes bacterium]|nr:MAG: NAD(P)-dependent glycerol-3-phosphate dehydrogenase [Candidatus Aminicenantes bacterium]
MGKDKILVIGGGSWGTAFANYLATSDPERQVKLRVREKEIIDAIRSTHENPVFLPGIKLAPGLKPVHKLKKEAAAADILIFAVPSKYIKNVFKDLKGTIKNKRMVNLSKGFEATSLKTISQLAAEVFGPGVLDQWVTISGPSFARELASNHPTVVAACSHNPDLVEYFQKDFSSDILRIYRCDDLVGIEVGGAMKNIMAIASGIVNGCGYGYNTTASLVTRASVEMMRFGLKLGARQETFWGLAGIGDLMLTCFGHLSRNFQLGQRIARGESLSQIEKSTAMVAEGVETTKAVKLLAHKMEIEMPITNEVYEILFNNKNPFEALRGLMKRRLQPEWNIN